ncbi:MAG: glycosyltransferase [Chloroflexota bacterium]|jgi:1,2-diacylglycerol 3-beta-galactosyltransferase
MEDRAGSRKILILTADAGFGHRSAANAVAKALDMRYGDSAHVAIVNPLDDPKAPPFLRSAESDYDKLAREWPQFYKLGYKMSDMAMTTSVTELTYVVLIYDLIARLMKEHQPDAVVVTFPTYQYPLAAYRRLTGDMTPMATIVTDLVSLQRMWFTTATDLCLVPTATAADLALERGLDPETIHMTGLPVNPLLADHLTSKQEARRTLGWEPEKFTVLAVGSKRIERLHEFVDLLNHTGFNLQIVAVAGGSEELYERFEAIDWHVAARTYNFVPNMAEFLQAADCVMTKAGGLIVTESLACGLPMFLMQVIPGQEIGNAKLVTTEGAGDLTLEPMELLRAMAHWQANDRRLFHERAANAQRLGKPEAAFAAAELIWQLAGEKSTQRPARFPIARDKLKDLLRQFSSPLSGVLE